MNLPGKVVTRVFKFSLHRIHINRSRRLSSIVLSKTCCNPGSFIKYTGTRNDSFSIFGRKVHSIAPNPTMGALSPLDPSSFSRPELAVVKHISLSLTVDFDKKVLRGVAILNLDALENITEVILDSSKLTIESVETEDGKSLKFCVGDEVPNYGSQLTVTLKDTAKFGDKWLWGECPVCVKPKKKIPNAKEDIKLAYKGFLYVPEFKIDEEKRRFRERQRDYFNAQCQCFYVKQVPELGPWDIVNRKISECSLQVPSKEEIFIAARVMHGKDNVKAKQGAIYVLGPNGSRHLITTYEELREVPQKCKDHAKEVAKAEALKPPVEKEKPHEKQKLALEKEIMILENKLAAEEAMAIPADIYDKSPLEKRIALEEKMATEKAMAVPAAIYESVDSLPDDVCEQLRLPKDMYPCSNETLPKHKMADQAERVQKLTIKIKYSTSPEASALAWLEPTQTSGKTHPYMFSQCQPIHARSIMPCQDTPAVKFTYDAHVTAPAEYTVLMSALRGEVNGTTTSFRQPMPLPAYLLAIAVGQIESKYLGPRSRVWSEQESLDKSAWEFAETERYLAAAEKLCGKYEWTEYDLLVLPPSFPYGGMENPCLTFVTPTLLAGDRSLADVIVHEIMHSWTGNLVTNRNFEHFWLNEGFTVYTERKVTASLAKDPEEGKKIRDFASILGLQELTETISTLGPDSPLTLLVPDLQTVHPDDAFSRVPYEKGSLFLRYLEDLLGGPAVFDEFLRSYLSHFSTKSIDTNDFKSYLYKYFDNDARLNQVDWDTWLYKPGMPPVIPNYDTSMTKSVDDLVDRIEKDPKFINTDVIGFTPQQMIYLLQKLVDGKPIPLAALPDLYNNYRLGESKNAEIMYRWVRICIRSKDKTKMDEYFNFVNSQGRMKYVRPIYRDLYAWEYARPMAIDNFLKNEKYMMHVSAYTLRKDLHLNES